MPHRRREKSTWVMTHSGNYNQKKCFFVNNILSVAAADSTQALAADNTTRAKKKRVRVRKLVLNDFRERFSIDNNEVFISVANRSGFHTEHLYI